MHSKRRSIAIWVAVFCACQSASAQSNDPPSRIGRVSYVTGSVSLQSSGSSDWWDASLNYPVTTGDVLWADTSSRAELHLGASAVHLAPLTSLALDAVEDSLIQLRLGQGSIDIRLRELDQNDGYEIDTPSGALILRAPGAYRVDVTPDGRRTTFTVRDGDADVSVGDQLYAVRPGSSVTMTESSMQPISGDVVAPDPWEDWANTRDAREDQPAATEYVSRDMVGYEDLGSYGDWQSDPDYGEIWYPRQVAADWAPYRTGRWVSVQPWGWTWVDDAPWGFAPFHYGRWSNQRGRWGWIPGREGPRPVYAPALVAFISGDSWSASFSFGSGGGIGWIPLAPREVYVPPYHYSPNYIRNVNAGATYGRAIDPARVNVATVQYANRNVSGAVTVVPRNTFVASQPVSRAAVRIVPAQLSNVQVAAAPIAAGIVIAALPRGVRGGKRAIDRPPVELPPSPRLPGAGAATAAPVAAPMPGRGNQPPPEAPRARPRPAGNPPAVSQPSAPVAQPTQPIPPANTPQNIPQGRGRGRGGQGVPTPPTAAQPVTTPVTPPANPPTGGRGRGDQTVPTTPQVTPPENPPRRGRGRGGQTNPPVTPPVTPPPPPARGGGSGTPPVTATPPAIPAPPPAPRHGRGRQSLPPATPTTPVPPPVTPPPPPPARGSGQTIPPPPPVVPQPPPPSRGNPLRPANPPGRGRGAPHDTGRGGKPPRPVKPDSGRGGGGGQGVSRG